MSVRQEAFISSHPLFSGQEKSKWFVSDRASNPDGLDGDFSVFVKKLGLKGETAAGRLIYTLSCPGKMLKD